MYRFELFDTPNVKVRSSFQLPDMRGVFLRGWKKDKGMDDTSQHEQFKTHTHEYEVVNTVARNDVQQMIVDATNIMSETQATFDTLHVDEDITICGNISVNGYSISDVVVNELNQLITPEYTPISVYRQPVCSTHYISASNVRVFPTHAIGAPTHNGRTNEYKLNDVIDGFNSQISMLSFVQSTLKEENEKQRRLIEALMKRLNISEGDLL